MRYLPILSFLVLFAACSEARDESVTKSSEGDIVAKVALSAEEVIPLMAGMEAPEFSLPTADGSIFSFDPDHVERPIVLTFYRGGWCPYCNMHLADMRNAEKALLKMGYDVVFASMDRQEILRSNLKIEDVQYTLLSDSKATLTTAFGLAYRVSDETVARYLKNGIDLVKDSGETHHILPTPATYVIGTDGVIDFAYVNPDYSVRVHPELVVKAAELALE